MEVVNLSGKGISAEEARKAAKWMTKAFIQAPAEPALNVMLGPLPHEENVEMHEAFWAAHINRVAHSGILLGARDAEGWKGFRCAFPPGIGGPGKGSQPFLPDYRIGSESDEDWTRFLELTGKDAYIGRLGEWSGLTKATQDELGLDTSRFFTTSIIVVDPTHQRKGIGRLLDVATRELAREMNTKLFIRTHDHALPFYTSQGFKVLASPTYALNNSAPFKTHFLLHDCES